jgi:flavin-dependent thymidylate synthase
MHSNKISVKLVKSFVQPIRNIASTAKTCYSSKGIVADDSIEFPKDENLITDLLKAGHHTTFEHQYFQFAISNVSRYAVWSLLHSHPYYNSEQVSQRYTKVIPNYTLIPKLSPDAKKVYTDTLEIQYSFYEELFELLYPGVEKIYFQKFPARRKYFSKYKNEIEKKSREIARYILPIGTFTYLYHTINTITLLRYYKRVLFREVSEEEELLVKMMIDEVINFDNHFAGIVSEIKNQKIIAPVNRVIISKDFKKSFDSELQGYSSKLVDYGINAEKTLADSVRMYFGLSISELNDAKAISRILDPSENKTLSSGIVLTNNISLSKALNHVRYTFKKKLSHAADSQNQRHRTIHSSGFDLTNMDFSEPDYIIPKMISVDKRTKDRYSEMMEIIWTNINKLINIGISQKTVVYLLPNAVTIRLIESGNLLNYHHKYAMRLCYNAQEEIWQNSLDEVKQISEFHPNIGKYLLPPCTLRLFGNEHPVCPEGRRFCGIKAWQKELKEYERII